MTKHSIAHFIAAFLATFTFLIGLFLLLLNEEEKTDPGMYIFVFVLSALVGMLWAMTQRR